MGGGCAVAMARLAPERVRGIVLAGAHAGPDPPERRPAREEMLERLRREGAEAVWEGEGPAPAADDLAAIVVALRERPDDRATVRGFGGPLLLVSGDRDPDPRLTPEAARELALSAPRGRHVLLEGAGHLVSVERPDDFNRELSRFLEACG